MSIPFKPQDKRVMFHGTRNERVAYFSPEKVTDVNEFGRRFLLWCRIYTSITFPWSFSGKHLEWGVWFAEMCLSKKQTIPKLVLSSRDLLKTYFQKRMCVFTHLYMLSVHSYFVSAAAEKVKEEMADMGALIKQPAVIADYGVSWKAINREEILFKDFKNPTNDGSKIAGSTLKSFPRGITHLGFKPGWLWVDDMETRETLRSAADTQANWLKYQSDVLSSLDSVKRRIFISGNHISILGNHQKLLDSLDDEDKTIVPLYNTKTLEIAHPQRWCFDEDEAVNSNPPKISINAKKKEYERQLGGEKMFRQEYLANPLGYSELYYDIRKIEEIYNPVKEPIEEYTYGGVTYRIYKKKMANKQYVVAIDPSEGIGLDHTGFVVIAFDAARAEIIVTAHENEVKQTEFCASNLQFFTYYGIKPFVVPEANQGIAYIEELVKHYPNNLIFRRERVGERGAVKKTEQFGLMRNQLTTRHLVAEHLKTGLESGSLINLCGILHGELQSYSNVDHTETFRRITPDTLLSNHFDLLSAAQNGWFGVEQAIAAFGTAKRKSLSDSGFYKRPTTLQKSTPSY